MGALMHIGRVAQCIAVCRRSKKMSMGLRRHRKGSRLCRRCALPRRRDTPRLRQILHATKCDKLSGAVLAADGADFVGWVFTSTEDNACVKTDMAMSAVPEGARDYLFCGPAFAKCLAEQVKAFPGMASTAGRKGAEGSVRRAV